MQHINRGRGSVIRPSREQDAGLESGQVVNPWTRHPVGPTMLVAMILSGWKEIAQYLRCGVRSAQRWQSMGLPVRHLHSGHRAPVVADSEEIDAWTRGGAFWRKKSLDTLANVKRSRELRTQVRRAREALQHTRDQLKKNLATSRQEELGRHSFELLRRLEIVLQKSETMASGIIFLRTELEVAKTFVAIAKRARYEGKIVRNLANARKACGAIRHFMDRVQLSEDEAAEIRGTLAKVENDLAELEHSARGQTGEAVE